MGKVLRVVANYENVNALVKPFRADLEQRGWTITISPAGRSLRVFNAQGDKLSFSFGKQFGPFGVVLPLQALAGSACRRRQSSREVL
jgi:hypothetical protein